MNKNEILNDVSELIVEHFGIDEARIKPESTLDEDLDFDSIDLIELILVADEKYGEKISADKLRSARTVQDVVDRLYDLLNEKKGEEVISH